MYTNILSSFRVLAYSLLFYTLTISTSLGSDLKESSSSELSGKRPNIIMFLADDQSITDHTTYGNKKVPTFVTHEFSKESLIFNNAFTGQAICAPSRSMLLTGMYPLKNGCYINHTAIRPGVKTLPSYLIELGYDVLLVGKSHLKPSGQFPWTKWIQPVAKEGYPRPGISVKEVDKYIAESVRPFCIIVASEYPHGPYFKESKYGPKEVELPPFENDTTWQRNYFGRYYTSIKEKENEFEAILELIDNHNLRDDTIVFYADDHGMARGKFTVYKSGLNVAFMVRWPGKIKPGKTDALTSFADFLPTVIDLANNQDKAFANDFDGKSLLGIFSGISSNQHEYLYGVGENQGIQNRHIFPQRSIYDGRYNYIYNFNSNERLAKLSIKDPVMYYFLKFGADKHKGIPEEELYDTLNDPFEMNNLAGKSEHLSLQSKLKSLLFGWMERQKDYLSTTNSIPYFKIWRHELDVQDPQFNYSIEDDKVGILEGKKVSHHKYGI